MAARDPPAGALKSNQVRKSGRKGGSTTAAIAARRRGRGFPQIIGTPCVSDLLRVHDDAEISNRPAAFNPPAATCPVDQSMPAASVTGLPSGGEAHRAGGTVKTALRRQRLGEVLVMHFPCPATIRNRLTMNRKGAMCQEPNQASDVTSDQDRSRSARGLFIVCRTRMRAVVVDRG